jgi:hypothetical protein
MSNYKKIFVIGFNKCGTTSLHHLFISLNFRSIHGRQKKILKNRYNYFPVLHKYDAFSDGEHLVNNFQKYYSLYNNSLFILNTRSMNNWIKSRFKHMIHNTSYNWEPNKKTACQWIIKREEHYTKVVNFFIDKPSNLLIINIEKNNWTDKLLTKLDISHTNKIHIHSNKAKNFNLDTLGLVDDVTKSALSDMNYPPDEVFLKNKNINFFPYDHNLNE